MKCSQLNRMFKRTEPNMFDWIFSNTKGFDTQVILEQIAVDSLNLVRVEIDNS